MRATLTTAILAALAAPCAFAVEIDGRIDPAEWQGAQHITDFRLTEPLSRAPAPQPTEAWILATPRGPGDRLPQPPGPAACRARASRRSATSGAQADRVNLYVDFDGDGRTGYNFTVLLSNSIIDTTITNENQFNDDWDGDWLPRHQRGRGGLVGGNADSLAHRADARRWRAIPARSASRSTA